MDQRVLLDFRLSKVSGNKQGWHWKGKRFIQMMGIWFEMYYIQGLNIVKGLNGSKAFMANVLELQLVFECLKMDTKLGLMGRKWESNTKRNEQLCWCLLNSSRPGVGNFVNVVGHHISTVTPEGRIVYYSMSTVAKICDQQAKNVSHCDTFLACRSHIFCYQLNPAIFYWN